MSDFRLSDEQKEFQSLAREFAEKEIKSLAHKAEQDGHLGQDVFRQAWEIGLATVAMPEESGGLGLPLLDCCLIAEELAAGCSGLSGTLEGNTLAQVVVSLCGSASQVKQYLPALAEKANLAGVDAQLFSSRRAGVNYEKRGNSFILNGTIAAVINADFCSWFIITATAGSESRVFVIAKDAPQVSVQEHVFLIGRKAMNMRQVHLRDLELGADASLGLVESDKFAHARARSFCLLAAGAVGVARAAMQYAVQYCKERKTFGQPIYQHQAVAFIMADMAKDIEAARLLVWQAAVKCGAGSDMVSSMVALANAQDVAMRVTTDAVQVYGGYGYSREYPVEKLMRDAKSYQICQCTNLETKSAIGQLLIGC